MPSVQFTDQNWHILQTFVGAFYLEKYYHKQIFVDIFTLLNKVLELSYYFHPFHEV